MDEACDYNSGDDEYSKKSSSPMGFLSNDGTNGAFSSSDESSCSDDFICTPSYRSKSLNHEEINNHLKGNLSFGLPSKNKSECMPYKNNTGAAVAPILLQQLTQPRMDYISKEIEASLNLKNLKEDIKCGYRLVRELMAASLHHLNSVFMAEMKNSAKSSAEFLEITKNPLWLPKIRQNISNGDYKSLGDIVRDLRVMIQNIYIFYGPVHSTTKKALNLEYVLERKLKALPHELKEECTLEKTNGITLKEDEITQTKSSRICVKGDVYFSLLLYSVRGCKLAREKEQKMKRIEAVRKAKRNKELEFLKWEQKLFEELFGSQIKAMWELPQIGQFLFVSLSALNIYEISQYEVERMLVVPQHSTTLRMLLTSLLSSPVQRQKIADKPYMPYKVWANKLATKVQHWYKIFKREKSNAGKVSEQLGIDPQFWLVCGTEWPFKYALFHELDFYKRVWLLKSLCDYVAYNHKSVQEVIMDQPENNLREKLLGKDREENEYIYFPQFINFNIRIYRRTAFTKETIEVEELSNIKTAYQKSKEKVFSQDQLKHYKYLIKNCKRKIKNEDFLEYVPVKKRKRSSTSRPKPTVSAPTPDTPRNRPRNLRQRPSQRVLNESVQQLSESDFSDEEFYQKMVNCSSNVPEKETVSKTQTLSKSLPPKRGRKKSYVCSVCGKQFSVVGALNGHMSMHSKKRKGAGRRSTRQSPESDSRSNYPEEETLKEETISSKQFNLDVVSPSDLCNNTPVNLMLALKQDTQTNTSLLTKAEVPVMEDKFKDEVKEETVKEEHLRKEVKVEQLNNCIKDELKDEAIISLLKEEPTKNRVKVKEMNESVNSELTCKSEVVNSEDAKKAYKMEMVSFCENNTPVEHNPSEEERSELREDEQISNFLKDPAEEETTTKEMDVEEKVSDSLIDKPAGDSVTEESTKGVWDFCDPNVFQLIASTLEELRMLIRKFGPVPTKLSKESKEIVTVDSEIKSGEEDEEEVVEEDNEEAMALNENLPDCEKCLYKALCELLSDYSPYESKFKVLHRQIMRKMYKEEIQWETKTSIYGDPDEEAWKSDPEPEPEPTPQTPQVSSSSSSSAEEFYDDGARKRKLRKRKGRPAQIHSLSGSCEQTPVSSPITEDEQERTTVSSRGRVRKVKKLVNYDKLDFEKLAEDATRVAVMERDRKRIQKVSVEEETKASPDFFRIPSSGVQRYIMSKTGDVTGYIDTAGQTHYCNRQNRDVKPAVPEAVASSDGAKSAILAVVAKTNEGKDVMIRVVGPHATSFLAKVEKEGRLSNRIITVTHHGKDFSIPLNSTFYTRNVPGYPDCIIPDKPPTKAVPVVQNISKVKLEPSTSLKPQTYSGSNIKMENSATSQNISMVRSEPTMTNIKDQSIGSCKRIIFQTPKGPLQFNVSKSRLEQGQQKKSAIVSPASSGSVAAGPSNGNTNLAASKLSNSINVYNSPLPSNLMASASTSGASRYIIMNQPTGQGASVPTQQTNNYIQINNANNNQIIQIQQPSNVLQYAAAPNPTMIQVVSQPTVNQPTFVPIANATIPQQNSFIQSTPMYNPLIVQSPTKIQIPSQSVIIPQTVQPLAPATSVTQLASNPSVSQLAAAPPISQIAPVPSLSQLSPQLQAPTLPGTRGNSKIFILQTNEGQKVCLQTVDGKLAILSNEQIKVLIKRGAIKTNPV